MFFVNKSFSNMYSKPFEGEVISQVIMGEKVEVLETINSFVKIQASDGYVGYVNNDAIVEAENVKDIVIIKEPLVNAYFEPSVKSKLVYTLPIGSILINGMRKENGYQLVKNFSGDNFYIQENTFIETQFPFRYQKQNCKNILKTALQFLNVPYFWGGKTPFGFDCSGFVQTVFALNGYNLKRDAYMQAEMDIFGTVDITDLKPCDLIFFGKDRINHVAIFIGSDRFIHATTTYVPKVQISKMDEFWISKIALIRRLNW